MQYIHLNNDSFILHTSKGLVNLNRHCFNFKKVKDMVEGGATEDEVSPFLLTPDLPNGIYDVYKFPDKVDSLYVVNTNCTGSGDVVKEGWWLGKRDSGKFPVPDSIKEEYFIGVYSSEKDVMFDYPEYIV